MNEKKQTVAPARRVSESRAYGDDLPGNPLFFSDPFLKTLVFWKEIIFFGQSKDVPGTNILQFIQIDAF